MRNNNNVASPSTIQTTTRSTPALTAFVIADPEGNMDFLTKSIINPLNTYMSSNREKTPAIICLGDVLDKGEDELDVLHYLVTQFKVEHPNGESIFILGNRDKNKMSYLTELTNREYVGNLLNKNLPPHWDKKPANYPLAFFRSLINDPDFATKYPDLQKHLQEKKTSFSNSQTDEELKQLYNLLDFSFQQVITLLWMQQHTMGIPNGFKNRKAFLQKKLERQDVTDIEVMQSFIEQTLKDDKEHRKLVNAKLLPETWVLPERYRFQLATYLEQGHEAYIINNTLFMHSSPSNQTFKDENLTLKESLSSWARNKTITTREQLEGIRDHMFGGATFQPYLVNGSQGVRTDEYSRSALPNTHTSFNHLDAGGLPDPEKLMTKTHAEALTKLGITCVAHGHQPCLTPFPTVFKHDGITYINADTSMNNMAASDEQKRGGTSYIYQIEFNNDSSTHRIQGMLGEKFPQYENTTVMIDPADPNIGTIITDNGQKYLVQAKDKNDDYCVVRRQAGTFPFVPNEGLKFIKKDHECLMTPTDPGSPGPSVDHPGGSRVHHPHSSPSALGLFKKPACYAGMALGASIMIGSLLIAAGLALTAASGGTLALPGLSLAIKGITICASAAGLSFALSSTAIIGGAFVAGGAITAASLHGLDKTTSCSSC